MIGSRHYCPLCPWTLDSPIVDDDPAATTEAVARIVPPLDEAALTFQEILHRRTTATLAASIQPVERALRAHCETHPLEEWLRPAVELFTLRRSLGALADMKPPADERVFAAVCAGELTTNDSRWIRIAANIIEALKAPKETADG